MNLYIIRHKPTKKFVDVASNRIHLVKHYNANIFGEKKWAENILDDLHKAIDTLLINDEEHLSFMIEDFEILELKIPD